MENENKDINIEVSEPYICKIDYSLPKDKLDKYLNTQMNLISSGQGEAADYELMMLAYAFDFIYWAKDKCHVEIDFDEQNIGLLEAILEAVHKMSAEGRMTQQEFSGISKKAAAYLGVVIIKYLGGSWAESNIGCVVQINGTNIFVYNRVARRIVNGAEADIVAFYNALSIINVKGSEKN